MGCVPYIHTLGAGRLLKGANMRAIARFVDIAKGDVLLSSYANVAKGQPYIAWSWLAPLALQHTKLQTSAC